MKRSIDFSTFSTKLGKLTIDNSLVPAPIDKTPSMYQNLAGSPVADRIKNGFVLNSFLKLSKTIIKTINITTGTPMTGFTGNLVFPHNIKNNILFVEIYLTDFGIADVSNAQVDDINITIQGASEIPISPNIQVFISEVLSK